MCHKDISPLDKGWKDHLLSKQCTKNDRNNAPTLQIAIQPKPDNITPIT